MFCEFEDILKTSSRLPFDERELKMLVSFTKKCLSRGHDLRLGSGKTPASVNDFIEGTNDGLCFSFSPGKLQTRFLFVKCSAGRGFFGGQKATYGSYLQSFGEDKWGIGPIFKSWSVAITSIGNVYRGNGF